MSPPLETELKAILDACQRAGVPVFVIGAFSVRAYDCLQRISKDLDLAISAEHWPALKQILTDLGYSAATTEEVWITAIKSTAEDQIEINIALNGVTDLNSASTFLITNRRPELRQPSDLDFPLPVLPLESIFITKLIAQREKDVADLLSILLLRPDSLNPMRFWHEADESGLTPKLSGRLAELAERIRGGEAMSIWYERTGLILSDEEAQSALAQLSRLQRTRPR